jgi:hypothetical protein
LYPKQRGAAAANVDSLTITFELTQVQADLLREVAGYDGYKPHQVSEWGRYTLLGLLRDFVDDTEFAADLNPAVVERFRNQQLGGTK